MKTPKLILAIQPNNNIEIPDFFNSNSQVVELLKKPHYLRYSGWNMLTLDNPKIYKGQAWEVKNGDVKTIRVYKNGGLVTIALLDDEYLGWGQEREAYLNNPKINALAFVEYCYEFAQLYSDLLRNFEEVNEINVAISMINLALDNQKKVWLSPFELGTGGEVFKYFQEEYKKNLPGDFEISFLYKITDNKFNPNDLGYKIIEQTYLQFGISTDKIPYSKFEDSKKVIDTDKILKK